MGVHVRIASNWRFVEIGSPVKTILDVKGRPCGVVPKGDPTDRTWIGAVLATGPFARPADYQGNISHGAVIGSIDSIPDEASFGGSRRELCSEADRLVRAEHQIET